MSSENPYEAPESQVPAVENTDRDHLRKVAKAQKNVLLVVLAYLCLIPLRFLAPVLTLPGFVLVLAFGAIAVFRMASLFRGKAVAIIYVIGMLVPLLGLLLLLSISQKATTLLQANGIIVGLLGANVSQI